jgi:hypothetical protein
LLETFCEKGFEELLLPFSVVAFVNQHIVISFSSGIVIC